MVFRALRLRGCCLQLSRCAVAFRRGKSRILSLKTPIRNINFAKRSLQTLLASGAVHAGDQTRQICYITLERMGCVYDICICIKLVTTKPEQCTKMHCLMPGWLPEQFGFLFKSFPASFNLQNSQTCGQVCSRLHVLVVRLIV